MNCNFLYLFAGNFKLRWVKKEQDVRIQAENKLVPNYTLHRPFGCLEVAVLRGKNLVNELGLPGSLHASVIWVPLKLADEKTIKNASRKDPTARGYHQIGTTSKSGITSNPVWDEMVESEECKRLRQLIPMTGFWTDTHQAADTDEMLGRTEKDCIRFPILQPLDHETKKVSNVSPFESSQGAVVVQIRFHDVLNTLPVFDDLLGEVIIPFSHLANENEFEGWYRLKRTGSAKVAHIDLDSFQHSALREAKPNSYDGSYLDKKDSKSIGDTLSADYRQNVKVVDEVPEVYLRIKFKRPVFQTEVCDAERESSIVIAEEMIRTAVNEEGSIGLIGSSISTINTVRGLRGNVQYIQNELGKMLDILEQIRNIFNFADPRKSCLIFSLLVVLWVILILVPTRLLVLAAGLAQYTVTFISTFMDNGKDQSREEYIPDVPKAEDTPTPLATYFMNFFLSLPTDEDLRRTYFWESRRIGERERTQLMAKKRKARLKKLWKAQWFGTLEIKKHIKSSAETERKWTWETVFGILQGHRFVWWKNEQHFDDGNTPLGQIYFAGHSGLAGLSPLDLKELKKNEIPLIVCIFGRGEHGQQKITLLTPDKDTKETLEDSVFKAFNKND